MLTVIITAVARVRSIINETALSGTLIHVGSNTVLNASNIISYGEHFVVNGDTILFDLMNSVMSINISSTQRITYQANAVSILNGNVLRNNINSFYYYGEFQFDGNKINPVRGFGVLYYNPAIATALFATNSVVISGIEAARIATCVEEDPVVGLATGPASCHCQRSRRRKRDVDATLPRKKMEKK